MRKSVNLIAFFGGLVKGERGGEEKVLSVESWRCNLFEFRLAKYFDKNFVFVFLLVFAAAKFLGHAGNAETRNAPEFRTLSL